MSGRLPINAGVFIQKFLEGGGRDRPGRTSSGFPLLQGGQFGGETGGRKSMHCLSLAQVIGLPPGLQTEDDRSRMPCRQGCLLLRKEPLKRRSRDGLRRRARSLPLLKSAELYWQAGVKECADSLSLAESVGRPPGFEFCDHGVQRLAGHQAVYDGDSRPRWQLVVIPISTMRCKMDLDIGTLPIVCQFIAGFGLQRDE